MENFKLKEKERPKDGLVTTYFTMDNKSSIEKISLIKKLIKYWISREDAQILINNLIQELKLEGSKDIYKEIHRHYKIKKKYNKKVNKLNTNLS